MIKPAPRVPAYMVRRLIAAAVELERARGEHTRAPSARTRAAYHHAARQALLVQTDADAGAVIADPAHLRATIATTDPQRIPTP